MEYNEFVRMAEDNKARRLSARATSDWSVMGYSEVGERLLETMPTYTYFQRPLQDPVTGKPYFMVGIHELGDEDTAGFAPPAPGDGF